MLKLFQYHANQKEQQLKEKLINDLKKTRKVEVLTYVIQVIDLLEFNIRQHVS